MTEADTDLSLIGLWSHYSSAGVGNCIASRAPCTEQELSTNPHTRSTVPTSAFDWSGLLYTGLIHYYYAPADLSLPRPADYRSSLNGGHCQQWIRCARCDQKELILLRITAPSTLTSRGRVLACGTEGSVFAQSAYGSDWSNDRRVVCSSLRVAISQTIFFPILICTERKRKKKKKTKWRSMTAPPVGLYDMLGRAPRLAALSDVRKTVFFLQFFWPSNILKAKI